MEATKDELGLLTKILPPRLEDAGLEDCALPPDSIKEAFFKAASAVKSRATPLFHEDDDPDTPSSCVDDPWKNATEDGSDSVVGVSLVPDALGPCGVLKGGGVVEEGEDKVVVVGKGGDEEAAGNDEVLVVGVGDVEEGRGGSGCVEGLKGLKIGGKEKKEDEEEKESKRPTIVEGFV